MTARRKLVAAVLTVMGMLAIYALGFHARTNVFATMSLDLNQPFWMESAQRFRYVEMVAGGEEIPNPDTRMWAPDGYDPRTDTILQEQLYGSVYRVLPMGDQSVDGFVRVFTRVLYCFGIFALVALSGVLTRNRAAALLACLAYAVILPAVERSTGQVLYREHLAIPVVVFHLYFLAASLQQKGWHNPLLAGLFLLVAMLAWKVMTFYLLFLVGFFAIGLVIDRRGPVLAAAAACIVPVWLVSVLFPVHLHFDRFHFGTAGVASMALVAVGVLDRRWPLPVWGRAAAWIGLTGVACMLLPEARSYDHAWETILARVSHLGHKPADPTELTFHARHFWSGNYRSPTLHRMLRDFGIPALAALPGVLGSAVRVWRTRRWDGHALLLFLTVAMGASYLVFRKLQAFPAMLLAVQIGVGWTLLARWRQGVLRVGLVALAGLMALQTYGVIPGPHKLLPPRTAGPNVSIVHTGGDLAALDGWISEHTAHDDVLLADFALSPYLLTECARPVALNCFFESAMVERYREYTESLFEDEATFVAFCRELDVRYVIHTAHQALRVDDEMSYRYTAAALRWDPTWAIAAMQYDPQRLQDLHLVWESAFFRVFRVARPGEARPHLPTGRELLFSRALAVQLFGDPSRPGWPERGRPEELMTSQVATLTDLALARTALTAGNVETAERLLGRAVASSPYEPRCYEAKARVVEEQGVDPAFALEMTRRGQSLRHALAGEGPMPALTRDP
jgi:hypothetical protein